MPTYEYHCLSCGERFERFQPISSEPFIECPQCNNPVRRCLSGGIGIIFKGSGFYSTDYKKQKSTDKNGALDKEKNAAKEKKPESSNSKNSNNKKSPNSSSKQKAS